MKNQEYLKYYFSSHSLVNQLLEREEIEVFASCWEYKHFLDKEYIIKKDDVADSFMCLISGKASVFLDEDCIYEIKESHFFGEAFFCSIGKRLADIIALGTCEVAVFTQKSYEKLLNLNPITLSKIENYFSSILKKNKIINTYREKVSDIKFLSLIAHNEMKESLIQFCLKYKTQLSRYPLVTTATTGRVLYDKAGLSIMKKVKSGPLGGDQAIGSLISENKIRGVIFFRDPLSPHPHQPDIEALSRLCDVYQLPFATNVTTAQCVISYLDSQGADFFNTDNKRIEDYLQDQQKSIPS